MDTSLIVFRILGTIVAKTGVIKQFGTYVNADGSIAVDAPHVAARDGVDTASTIVGNIVGGWQVCALSNLIYVDQHLPQLRRLFGTEIQHVPHDRSSHDRE